MNQKDIFYLMNKDKKVLSFSSEKNEYQEVEFQAIEQYNILPIGFQNIGNWIKGRQAPKHRAHIESLLRSIGCYDLDGYIRITHALSLNDTFWVKQKNSNLKWADVSLFENEFDETISHVAFEGGLYGEQFSTTSPEFGTDGSFAKCWVRLADGIHLMKRGSAGTRNAGLEPYSEMYAAQLAKEICHESVSYDVVKYRGKIASKCKLFTSENVGFVPAYRCIEGEPTIKKMLQFYAEIGSENDFRRMLVLDALILNIDRHAGNYGTLFRTDTLEFLKMAPVFDNNQSLLPYGEIQDLTGERRKEYLAGRPIRIGNDFNEVAHSVLTKDIQADLINLKGFQFERNHEYALPEERLKALEEIVNMQIKNILQDIRLYISMEQKQVSDVSGNKIMYKKKVEKENKRGGRSF